MPIAHDPSTHSKGIMPSIHPTSKEGSPGSVGGSFRPIPHGLRSPGYWPGCPLFLVGGSDLEREGRGCGSGARFQRDPRRAPLLGNPRRFRKNPKEVGFLDGPLCKVLALEPEDCAGSPDGLGRRLSASSSGLTTPTPVHRTEGARPDRFRELLRTKCDDTVQVAPLVQNLDPPVHLDSATSSRRAAGVVTEDPPPDRLVPDDSDPEEDAREGLAWERPRGSLLR